jgi:hypothetical protein
MPMAKAFAQFHERSVGHIGAAGFLPEIADGGAGGDDEEGIDGGHDGGEDHRDKEAGDEGGEEILRHEGEDVVLVAADGFGGVEGSADDADEDGA